MPTHPECLYYLYKGYTHEIYVQEKSKPTSSMEGLYTYIYMDNILYIYLINSIMCR